jgi:hypothetical protein
VLWNPLKLALTAAPRTKEITITCARNFDDVMTVRLFDAGYRGFYVDIGAAHPDVLSVTRHFYDQDGPGLMLSRPYATTRVRD